MKIYWQPKGAHFNDPPITEADMEETAREIAEWERSPEGQAFLADEELHKAERMQRASDPNRLSNRVDQKDLPMHFARAVQRIWDAFGTPCTLREAGTAAHMDGDEYVIAAAFALSQGLVRHPTHPDYPDYEAPSLFEPCIG
jgi:hypothetical protein